MTTEWIIFSGIGILLLILTGMRLAIPGETAKEQPENEGWAFSQTTGNKEIQADIVQVCQSRAGTMAVLADGIGKENTGKLAAQVAADAVLDAYEPYHVLNNPEYLFRTAFLEAHSRVRRTIGERRGGAGMGAVFMNGRRLYYALAGDIRIALLRNKEIIPISKGQTMNVLAKDAYDNGLISRQETIWSLEETRIWNYLGKDGFREIEVSNPPVTLKPGDLVLMASRGIYAELSWAEIEELLLKDLTMKEKADGIVRETEKKTASDKENGTVLLLTSEVTDEKNQF